jgi:protein-tyrosine phosphatase
MNLVFPNENREVPDPYYGTEKDFEEVFQMINTACQKLVNQYAENIFV